MLLNTEEIKNCISGKSSIRDVLTLLEKSYLKIALVIDDSGALVRTVTDGDVRRGLIRGLDLDSRIEDLPGRKPVTCRGGQHKERVRKLMREERVSEVIGVDLLGRPDKIFKATDLHDVTHLSPPHMSQKELAYVEKAFDENWIAPAGPNIKAFEQQLEQKCQRQHALAVSSGTAALHLALRVLGISTGDLVYVSDLTFVASVQPILYQNALPVLIDAEPCSWNMCPDALARRLSEDAGKGHLPRAIIVVHLYGQSAAIEKLCAIARQFNVPVIEDAAESLGASFAGRPSGSHGCLAALSFNGNKIITTSGGGALLSDDPELITHAGKLSTQGRDTAEHYQHSEVAYNYRMSNVLAGIGCAQLEVLEERVAARRAVFERYKLHLGRIDGVTFQGEVDGSHGSRWLSVMLLDAGKVAVHPYQLMRRLRQEGIETRPGWKPMHLQPLCEEFEFVTFSSERACSSEIFFRSLCLPSGSAMSEAQQDRVIDRIQHILQEH